MKSKIFLFVGVFMVVDVIQKLVKCPACDDDYFGYVVSGYTYLAIKIVFAAIILYSAYTEHQKRKNQLPKEG